MKDITPLGSFYVVCFLFLVLMLTTQYAEILQTCVFAHDELPFLGGYRGYLGENGRWINFLLYEGLVFLNGKLIILVNVASFCVFSYFVFRNWMEKSQALLCALTTIFFPQVHLLNDWPLTLLPSFLLLAVAALLHKKVDVIIFFLLFGILFNGVLSHFYFLLPLLFLTEDRSNLLRVLFLWLVGFFVGFFCAEVLTKMITGGFIHLSGWRDPHYVKDWESLVDNLIRLSRMFLLETQRMGAAWLTLIAGAFMIFVCRLCRRRYRYKEGVVFIMLLMVAFSIYAQALPAGIVVVTRSVLCLYFSLFVFVCLYARVCKYLLPVVCLLISVHLFWLDMRDIQYWNGMGNTWLKGLQELRYEPAAVSGMVMLSSDKDFAAQERKWRKNMDLHPVFSSRKTVMEWAPAARTLGFNVVDPAKVGKIQEESIEWQDGRFYQHALVGDYLFLRIK